MDTVENNIFAVKRKSCSEAQNKQNKELESSEIENCPISDRLNGYLTRFTKMKLNKEKPLQDKKKKTRVDLRRETCINKGYFMLPKEVIIEKLRQNGIYLKQYNNASRGDTYYECVDPSCSYRQKITGNINLLKRLNSSMLIKHFKEFDIESVSELEEGISLVQEYNCHIEKHFSFETYKKSIEGKPFYFHL